MRILQENIEIIEEQNQQIKQYKAQLDQNSQANDQLLENTTLLRQQNIEQTERLEHLEGA